MSKNLTIRVSAKTYELMQQTAAKCRISILDLTELIFGAGLETALTIPSKTKEKEEGANEA